MIFEFTEEQESIRREMREFALKELAPYDSEWEEKAETPRHTFRKMGELGVTGMLVPEEYGGSDLGRLIAAIVFETLAMGSLGATGPVTVHNMAASLIYNYGNEKQRQKFVTPLARGEKLGALSVTEPNAGSDAQAIRTSVVRDGSDYILNGTKKFVTSGGEAEIYVVMCKTGLTSEERKISSIIVEKGTPGFSFGPREKKMGYHAYPTTDLIFEDCRVPRENLLSQEGDGFKITMSALNGGRINVGAIAVGVAQEALDYSIRYALEREQFGQPVAYFQGIQFKLADLATEIEASRLLVYQAAYRMDKNLPHVKEASMAKRFATDTAMRVTTEAVQILGGYGYMREYPVERYMRYAKMTQLVEGTNEIQKLVIARHLLKEA